MLRRRIALLLALSCSVAPALADAFTTPYTFTAGTTIQSAQVNSNFSYIASFFNTPSIANDNIKSGAAINPTKLDLTAEFPILRSAAARCLSAGTTGDTVYRCTITADGYIQFGPGGSSALDTMLKRSAAGILQVFADTSGTTYGEMQALNFTLRSASNNLKFAAASIATAARTVTWPDPGANVSGIYATSGFTSNAGGVAYGTGNSTIDVCAAGTSGKPLVSAGASAPSFATLGISGGGTNNASLGVSALGIYTGDGTKMTQITGTANQQFRVNAGGTAIEAFTSSSGGFTISAKTANFTADTAATFYTIDTSGGAVTVTLDSAVAAGSVIKFQRITGSNKYTFSPNGGLNIKYVGISNTTSLDCVDDSCVEVVRTSSGWTVS